MPMQREMGWRWAVGRLLAWAWISGVAVASPRPVENNRDFVLEAQESVARPKIFNGSQTFDHPAVGALLKWSPASQSWLLQCSGVLIGPSVFLTAAHCLCPSRGARCQPGAVDGPEASGYRIFFQHAGVFPVELVAIPTEFEFPAHDYAVLDLVGSVHGIKAPPLAETSPSVGDAGIIVGFGNVDEYSGDLGVKREGGIVVHFCSGLTDEDLFLCWLPSPVGSMSNTCPGDSGGPLFFQEGAGVVVGGITSGGYGRCDGPGLSFDTAIRPFREQILNLSRRPITQATLGETSARTSTDSGVFDVATTERTIALKLETHLKRLVITGNGVERAGNRFELLVRRGAPPTDTIYNCKAVLPGTFQSCEILDPEPGSWHVTFRHIGGPGGAFQLTATGFTSVCSLDVDGDGLFSAFSDGLLIVRKLFGLTSEALVAGVLGTDSVRSTGEEVGRFVEQQACRSQLDVDGSGTLDPLTDGLLILRYLLGIGGRELVEDALHADATRRNPGAVRVWLDGLLR